MGRSFGLVWSFGLEFWFGVVVLEESVNPFRAGHNEEDDNPRMTISRDARAVFCESLERLPGIFREEKSLRGDFCCACAGSSAAERRATCKQPRVTASTGLQLLPALPNYFSAKFPWALSPPDTQNAGVPQKLMSTSQ